MIEALKNHLDYFDQQVEVLKTYYAWAAVKPQSKQSTRFGSFGAYTSKEKQDYVKELVTQLNITLLTTKLEGAVGITILYSFPFTKKDLSRKMSWTLMTSRPDIDNLMKPVLDALQEKILSDDGYVCQAKVRKIRLPFPSVSVRLDLVRENAKFILT